MIQINFELCKYFQQIIILAESVQVDFPLVKKVAEVEDALPFEITANYSGWLVTELDFLTTRRSPLENLLE